TVGAIVDATVGAAVGAAVGASVGAVVGAALVVGVAAAETARALVEAGVIEVASGAMFPATGTCACVVLGDAAQLASSPATITSDCADDILVVDDMQWYLPTKREAHDFLRQLPIPGVETRSLPMPNRMLQD